MNQEVASSNLVIHPKQAGQAMPYLDPVKQKQASHESYLRNKDKIYGRYRDTRVLWARKVDLLKSKPCMDCGGEFQPCVMDFDHREPADKIANVSRLVRDGKFKQILDEIAKCDVVCANCHRIRTWRRNKQKKLLSSIGKDTGFSTQEAEFNSL